MAGRPCRSFPTFAEAVLLLGVEVPPPAVDVPASPLARAGVRLLLCTLGKLPAWLRSATARAVGALAFALGIRRRLTLEQLRWAFPGWSATETRRIARRAYQNMGVAALEGAVSHYTSPQEVAGSVVREDGSAIERALLAGRGVLIATAHFGSWELLGEGLARQGLILNAVVRPLKGAFNAEVVAGRVRSGLRLIWARNAFRGTLAALRRNEAVVVLIDQAIGGKQALFVPFFGRPAATTPLISLAARHSGAPVLVGFAPRLGNTVHLRMEGPFPFPNTGDKRRDLWTHTATLTGVLEQSVRTSPDQWLWLHRRWKIPPPDEETPRLQLLALAADAYAVRTLLTREEGELGGDLFPGFSEAMEPLLQRNAAWLASWVDAHGWPGRSVAGADGAEAAWRILLDGLGEPALQRRCLPLLEAAAASGEAPALQPAMLFDRICVLEGRPQRYGTALDWDDTGRLTAGPLEAAEVVDGRRATLGLPPLAEALVQEALAPQRPVADLAGRRAKFDAWKRRVGWRM